MSTYGDDEEPNNRAFISHLKHSNSTSSDHIPIIGHHFVTIIFVLVAIVTVAFAAAMMWRRRRRYLSLGEDRLPISKSDLQDNYYPNNSGFRIFPTLIPRSSDYCEQDETTHLMEQTKNENNLVQISSPKRVEKDTDSAKAQRSKKKSSKSPSNSTKAGEYFHNFNTIQSDDASLLAKFSALLAEGIVLVLHTSQGPKSINMSLIDDEIRWQTVKQSSGKQKRYKLSILDVLFVESGRQQGHSKRSLGNGSNGSEHSEMDTDDNSFDERCFALVTARTSLCLEASCKIDRDCFVRGFQLRFEATKST